MRFNEMDRDIVQEFWQKFNFVRWVRLRGEKKVRKREAEEARRLRRERRFLEEKVEEALVAYRVLCTSPALGAGAASRPVSGVASGVGSAAPGSGAGNGSGDRAVGVRESILGSGLGGDGVHEPIGGMETTGESLKEVARVSVEDQVRRAGCAFSLVGIGEFEVVELL